MKKSILFLVSSLLCAQLFGGTKTLSSGSTWAAAVWSPAGTPASTDDIVITTASGSGTFTFGTNGITCNSITSSRAISITAGITLTVSGSAGVSLTSGASTITGTLNTTSLALSGSGTGVTVSGAGKITGSGTLSLGSTGSFSNSNTTSGAVTFAVLNQTSGTLTITGNTKVTGAMTVSGGTCNLSGTLATGSLTVSAGTVSVTGSGVVTSTGVISISSTGTLTLNNATGSASGGSFSMANGTLNLGQSTSTANISFPTISGSKSVSGGIINIYASTSYALNTTISSYYNLSLFATNSASNPTFTTSGTLTVSNALVVTNNSLNGSQPTTFLSPGSNAINLTGSFTLPTNSNFIPGTSTVTFNGTGTQAIPTANFYNLSISKSSGTANAGSSTIGIANAFTISNTANFSIGTSTINYNGTVNQTILTSIEYANISVSNSGTSTKVTVPSSPALKVKGDLVTNSSFDALTNNATVQLTGAGVTQTISGGTYYNLYVSMSTLSGVTPNLIFASASTIINEMVIGGVGLSDPGTTSFIDASGNLTINNNASLVDNNQNGGSSFLSSVVILKNAVAASKRAFFVTTPVQSASTTDLQVSGTYNVLSYATDQTPSDYNSRYAACSRSGGNGNIQVGSSTGLYKRTTGTLTVGMGYSIYQDPGTNVFSFTGIPNFGSIDVSSFASGSTDRSLSPWNWCPDQNYIILVGNPYPCAIDWNAVYTNSGNTLVTYAKVWNGSTYTDLIAGSQQPIRTAQAFFIQLVDPTNSGTPTTIFDNTTFISDNSQNGTLLRKETGNIKAKLVLTDQADAELLDELNFVLNDETKEGIEIKYDALDWKGLPEAPSITAIQDGGEYSTLQFPTPTSKKVVPLAIEVSKSASYVFTCQLNSDLPAGIDLVLVDKLNKKDTYLSSGAKVNLNLAAGYNPSQYEIQFRAADGDGNVSESGGTSSFFVSSVGSSLSVGYNEKFSEGTLYVYDVSGRLVNEKNGLLSGNQLIKIEGLPTKAAYIVKLVTDSGVKTKKTVLE